MNSIGDAATIAAGIRAANVVHIAGHENPDGDAICSMLALRIALLDTGRTVALATPTPPPQRYDFLPGFAEIASELPSPPPDLAIALDCDGVSRLADLQPAFEAAPVVADVDHHRPDSAFGDLRFVDPTFPATSTMVMAILREMDYALTPEIATCLYVGLITDTGGFRFTNTSPEAMRDAARLLEAGADAADLARRIFSVRPLGAALLEGRALLSLTRHAADRVLMATLFLTDFAETDTSPEHTDGLIDRFRDIIGADVAVMLKQTEPDTWGVSMRSQTVNVADVAAAFGGGGHRLAAGCTIEGALADVRESVLAALDAALPEVTTSA